MTPGLVGWLEFAVGLKSLQYPTKIQAYVIPVIKVTMLEFKTVSPEGGSHVRA